MRLAGLLIVPVILALLIVMGAARLSSALSEPISETRKQASGLVWDGRVFTTRAAFAKWLEERGLSIQEWESRHPASPWTAAKPTRAVSSSQSQDVAPRSEQGSNWFVLALAGAVALIAGLAGAAALRHRRTAMPRRVSVHRLRDARPALPASKNGSRQVKVTAPRPSLAVAALAVQRGVEAARPRVHTVGVAAQRGVEVAAPRLENAGSAALEGLGTAAAQTAELSRRLRYEIKTERFRVGLFYVLAALFAAAIGLAVAIAAA